MADRPHVKAAVTEDQNRDANYFRNAPDMARGGGEGGSLNVPDMIEQIKRPIAEAEQARERERRGRE